MAVKLLKINNNGGVMIDTPYKSYEMDKVKARYNSFEFMMTKVVKGELVVVVS